ncbi:hypothetical protein EP331_00045 [bacterium]|nr:MAG: hypothetical protein EP331_00045 [bacterium]
MILAKLRKWLSNLPIFSVSHSSIPKCECGEDCFVERPAATIIGIGRFEAHILNHKKDIYSKYCLECFMDIQNEPMKEACGEAYSDGYTKGYYDNRRY